MNDKRDLEFRDKPAETGIKLNNILTALILGVASWVGVNIEYIKEKTNELHIEIKANASELKFQRYILEKHLKTRDAHAHENVVYYEDFTQQTNAP